MVAEREAKDEELEHKRELLRDYTNTEAQQLGGTLAFQASRYMKAAWQVRGEPKKEKAEIIEKEKLDYELFDRWLAFLSRKPTFYPYLKDWQAMIARGGTAKEAEALATEFQQLIVGVLLEDRELKKENDVIKAQALPSTKPKKISSPSNSMAYHVQLESGKKNLNWTMGSGSFSAVYRGGSRRNSAFVSSFIGYSPPSIGKRITCDPNTTTLFLWGCD